MCRWKDPAPEVPLCPPAKYAALKCASMCLFRLRRTSTGGSATVPHLAEVWSYINPFMLYGRHLGFKGNFEKLLAARDAKAMELFHKLEEVKHEVAGWMKVRAVWQFLEAERDGNSIYLFAPGAEKPLETLAFGRQAKSDGLCLSDYILEPVNGQRDHIAMFVVTAGEGVIEHSAKPKTPANFSKRTASRRSRSRLPKPAPNGFIAAFAKTGASPILLP